MTRPKQLVAFRPEVLGRLERLLQEHCDLLRDAAEPEVAEALRDVKNAKRLYAGEAPGIRVAPRPFRTEP